MLLKSKMKSLLNLCVLIVTISLCNASADFKNCQNTKANQLQPGDVTISACSKNKCILKRNTDASISMKFTPNRDFEDVNTDAQGILLDVPLPFPGYYGTSACPFIYDAEGENKVGCPLKAGETYVYKNSFKILPVYPTVSLTVHWGLNDKNGDAACFEIPVKIRA